jgi:uncharacterized protein (TIGR02145 family)
MMKTIFFKNMNLPLLLRGLGGGVLAIALGTTAAAQTTEADSSTAAADTTTIIGAKALFTDPRDGKQYKTIVMPDGRTWFAQNLNYTPGLTFNPYSYEANGEQFTSTENGAPAIGSYWCPMIYVGGKDQTTCHTYGALYTWETAMMMDGKYADETKMSKEWNESWVAASYFTSGAPGTTPNADQNNARGGTEVKGGGRGICPTGWHVPTDSEWAQLFDAVEGNTTYTLKQIGTGWWGADAGQQLKSAGTYIGAERGNGYWANQTHRGTDVYGFGAVPAGYRRSNGAMFVSRGLAVAYWSSSVSRKSYAWCRNLNSSTAQVYRVNNARSYGFSVRCIKDTKKQQQYIKLD